MIDWYSAFIVATLILWAISTPQDRSALRIVLIASLASELIVDGVTHQIHGAWKLIIPGALEIATIWALLKWARNRTGLLNAGLLVIAWLAHMLCYVDIALKTDLAYSRYESIIFWVSAGQLATCYDTMRFNFNRVCDVAVSFGPYRISDLSTASLRAFVSRLSHGKKIQPAEGKCAAIQSAPVVS